MNLALEAFLDPGDRLSVRQLPVHESAAAGLLHNLSADQLSVTTRSGDCTDQRRSLLGIPFLAISSEGGPVREGKIYSERFSTRNEEKYQVVRERVKST